MREHSAPGRRRAGIVVDAVRRRWGVVAASAVLVGLVAALLSGLGGHSYTASATVFVRPLQGNAFTSGSLTSSQVTTVALNTEANLVASPQVTARVNADLGTHLTPASAGVRASVPVDTQLVVISARASSGGTARRYAAAYASAFLDYRAALARQNQSAALSRLRTEETAARAQLASAASTANLPNPPADAASELQLATGQLAAVETAIGQLSSMDTNPGSVVRPAHVGAGSVFGSAPLMAVLGVLLGLAAGVALVVWREVKDDRIRGTLDTAVEDVPLLAVVPSDRRDATMREVRTSVVAAAPKGAVLGVSPIGADEAEPAASVAVRLAGSLAAAGYRVVLLDAGIDAPHVGALLELTGGPGVSNLLTAGTLAPTPPQIDGIGVLTAGSHVEDARERYGGEAMGTLLAHLRAHADYVLVVTPAMDSGDGAAVVRLVDRALLVALDGVTKRGRTAGAVRAVARLERPVVGFVAVTPQPPQPTDSEGAEAAEEEEPVGAEAEAEDTAAAAPGERAGVVSRGRGDGEPP